MDCRLSHYLGCMQGCCGSARDVLDVSELVETLFVSPLPSRVGGRSSYGRLDPCLGVPAADRGLWALIESMLAEDSTMWDVRAYNQRMF